MLLSRPHGNIFPRTVWRLFLRKSTKQTDNEGSDGQDGVAGNMERCVPVASRQNYAKYMPLMRFV